MKIVIRPADLSDMQDILDWRNDPDTRRMSFETGVIALEDHAKWFGKALTRTDLLMLIGVRGDEKVGVVRYDLVDGQAEVSINLNPACRGQGLSCDLLLVSEAALPTGISRLVAKVKGDNAPSQRLFLKAGYKAHSDGAEYTLYTKDL